MEIFWHFTKLMKNRYLRVYILFLLLFWKFYLQSMKSKNLQFWWHSRSCFYLKISDLSDWKWWDFMRISCFLKLCENLNLRFLNGVSILWILFVFEVKLSLYGDFGSELENIFIILILEFVNRSDQSKSHLVKPF